MPSFESPTNDLRVAVYARYSSDLQNQTSIESQLLMCEQYVERQGWNIVQVYADESRSGRTEERPEFQKMLQDSRANRFDIVLVHCVDRLTRNVVIGLQAFEIFAYSNIRLHSVNEGRQNFLNVMLNALGAQMFAEKIGVHTRAGIARALTKDSRLHSVAYGYRKLDTVTGLNREIDPETAPIVRRIFRMAADGISAYDIARQLNREGIPGSQGGAWDAATLRGGAKLGNGLLRKTIYAGTVTYGRTEIRLDPEFGLRRVAGSEENIVTAEIPELAIVPKELFDRVQKRLKEVGDKATKADNPRAAHRKKYLLSGLLKCDCCDRDCIKVSKNRYGCSGYRNGSCDNAATIRQDEIEERVFAALRASFVTPELESAFEAAVLAEMANDPAEDGKALVKRLRKARKSLTRKRNNLITALEEGEGFAAVRERMETLEQDIAEISDQLETAETELAEAQAPPPDIRGAYGTAVERINALLSDPDLVHQAHEALAILIREVRLRSDETASNGMKAEILTDLGQVLLAAGNRKFPPAKRFIVLARQLTVRHWSERQWRGEPSSPAAQS